MRLVGGASAAESLLKSAADYQGKHVPQLRCMPDSKCAFGRLISKHVCMEHTD